MMFAGGAFLLVAGVPAQQPSSVSAGPASAGVWLDVHGAPLPFKTDQELLGFLHKAKVKEVKSIAVGITGPQRLTLEVNGIRAHAHFNHVDEDKPLATFANGKRVLGFRDSHRFLGAAYELALILGLDNVPPSIERMVQGQNGTVTAWVENAFTERDRLKKKLPPPRPQQWAHQMQNMHVWDNLIYNTDRNQGNILIDANWKLWMIDHTRAFRRNTDLLEDPDIALCGRLLFQRLKDLNEAEVRKRMKSRLRGIEIDALLKRRVKLIAYIEDLIREKGEAAVLFKEDY